MFTEFITNRRLSSKVLWSLFIIGLVILICGRAGWVSKATSNLLINSDFETPELTDWKIIGQGDVSIVHRPVSGNRDNTVLALDIPQGIGIGIGQFIAIAPFQRYKFVANYRLAYEGQRSIKIVLRVSQFDQTGELIKEEELLNPEQLITELTADGKQLITWNSLTHNFISDERAAAVEIGIGFLGDQTATIEIDNLVFQAYPTWVGTIRQDRLVLTILLLLIMVIAYLLGRTLWPIRRKLVINSGLALVSLVLTLLILEVVVGFIPIQLISLARVLASGLSCFLSGR